MIARRAIIALLLCLCTCALAAVDLYADVAISLLSSNSQQAVTTQVPHDGTPGSSTATVSLAVTCSDAPHDSLRFNWACPSQQNTADPVEAGYDGRSRNITITLGPGTHTCQATVTGIGVAQLTQQTKDVQITVNTESNTDPTATWQASVATSLVVPHDGDPATTVATVLLAVVVSDSDGDDVDCQWTCNGGEYEGCKPSISLPAGSHSCVCTVTDSYGATGTLTKQIDVMAEPNQAPSAQAGADVTVTAVHDGSNADSSAEVQLIGSASTDPDGDSIVSYTWDCDGVTASVANQIMWLPVGTHQCTLTAEDAYGASSSDDMSVTVISEPNQAPVAHAGADMQHTSGSEVTLNGGGSSDPDGDDVSHAWMCEDSGNLITATATGASPSVQFPPCTTTCVHTCTVTVTDAYDEESTVAAEITITA